MTRDDTGPGYPSKDLSDEALEWIVRLNSGNARKRDRSAFATWRAQSAEHEIAAAEAEALWGEASDLHWDAETGLVRPGRHKKGLSRRAVLGGIAGAGVVGAGAVGAASGIRPFLSDYVTNVAERRSLELSDGTRVVLDAMSALDVDFTPSVRLLRLVEGQAYFEVARDTTRPFRVAVRGATVSALGTAFVVDRNLADGRIGITVIESAVQVQLGDAVSGNDVRLSEGHRAVLSRTGNVGPVTKQDPRAAVAWKSGVLIAEDMALADVVAALGVYHSGWIIMESEAVKTLKVNAVLELGKPQASLDTLAAGLPVQVRHVTNFLTIISNG